MICKGSDTLDTAASLSQRMPRTAMLRRALKARHCRRGAAEMADACRSRFASVPQGKDVRRMTEQALLHLDDANWAAASARSALMVLEVRPGAPKAPSLASSMPDNGGGIARLSAGSARELLTRRAFRSPPTARPAPSAPDQAEIGLDRRPSPAGLPCELCARCLWLLKAGFATDEDHWRDQAPQRCSSAPFQRRHHVRLEGTIFSKS
jgi:hypothetical protein